MSQALSISDIQSGRNPDGEDRRGSVPRSTSRVLDLLEAVLFDEHCSLTAAATATGLTPTTALRHLRGLEGRGYLVRDRSGLYSAGPTLRRIAATVHQGSPLDRLIEAAQPRLDDLAEAIGESCYLAVLDRETVTYVATAEGSHPIRHVGWVGQAVPTEGTAVGQALGCPGQVITIRSAVESDIVAVSLGLPPTGSIRAALSIIGPASRLDRETCDRAAVALRSAADDLARDLALGSNERNSIIGTGGHGE